jgi:hypothetical protein
MLHQSTAFIDTGHESRDVSVPRGGTEKTSATVSSVQAEAQTGHLPDIDLPELEPTVSGKQASSGKGNE